LALRRIFQRRPAHHTPHHYDVIPEGAHDRYYHIEDHFESPELIRDIILGISDGLTVPFALSAGLSSMGSNHLVITGGLAELISGAISMGLGGYLSAKSEADHYYAERRREEWEVENCLDAEIQEIYDIMSPYGLDQDALAPVIEKFKSDPQKFVDFMMKFELNLEKPDPSRSWQSAVTIGISYFIAGLIPLIPYFFVDNVIVGLYASSLVTLACLLIFGYIKALFTSPEKAWWGAIQTALVGGIAAAASYGGVWLIEHKN